MRTTQVNRRRTTLLASAALAVMATAGLGGCSSDSASSSSGSAAPAVSTVTTPSVLGLAKADAVAAIEASGLTVGATSEEPSDLTPGTVLAQTPLAGDPVAPGASVTLTLAAPPSTVTVPDVTGIGLQDATKAIADAGLVVGTIKGKESAKPVGTVVGQKPDAQTEVDPVTRVDLTVSSGQLVVPDVVGMTQAEASADLNNAGFNVTTQPKQTNNKPAGTVTAQHPDGGTSLDAGDIVVLTIAVPPAQPAPTTTVTVTPTPTLSR